MATPPRSPRRRTCQETAGVGIGRSLSRTSIPAAAKTSAVARANSGERKRGSWPTTMRRASPGLPEAAETYHRAVALAMRRISSNVQASAMTPRHPSVPKAIFKASGLGGDGGAPGRGAPERGEARGVVALPLQKLRGAGQTEAAVREAVEQHVDASAHRLRAVAAQVEEHDAPALGVLHESSEQALRRLISP